MHENDLCDPVDEDVLRVFGRLLADSTLKAMFVKEVAHASAELGVPPDWHGRSQVLALLGRVSSATPPTRNKLDEMAFGLGGIVEAGPREFGGPI